jgi:hypothetical protein
MNTTVELEAKPVQGGEWNGWFQGRFKVEAPGQYHLDLVIPESGETLSKNFVVKESNPELDNTRPDFGHLYQLASEVTDYLPRMDKDTQKEVKEAVERTSAALLQRVEEQHAEEARRAAAQPGAAAPKAEVKRPAPENKEAARFFFDLRSAHLIPKCMVTESKVQRSRGPVKDLWDQGFTISEDPAVRMATVLVIVTLLLSAEWLTRSC